MSQRQRLRAWTQALRGDLSERTRGRVRFQQDDFDFFFQYVVTPREEGADTHAIGTNLSLMSQIVFDWLDETFAGVEAGPAAGSDS